MLTGGRSGRGVGQGTPLSLLVHFRGCLVRSYNEGHGTDLLQPATLHTDSGWPRAVMQLGLCSW